MNQKVIHLAKNLNYLIESSVSQSYDTILCNKTRLTMGLTTHQRDASRISQSLTTGNLASDIPLHLSTLSRFRVARGVRYQIGRYRTILYILTPCRQICRCVLMD